MAKLQTDTGNVQVTITGESEGDGLVLRDGVLVNERVSVPSGVFVGARISDPAGGDQALGVDTTTLVTFDTVDFDTGGFADLTADNDRLTIPEDGYYQIGGTVGLVASSGNRLDFRLYKNGLGGTLLGGFHRTETTKAEIVVASGTHLVNLVAGDYISLGVNSEDGSDLFHAVYSPFLWVQKVDEGQLLAGYSPILDHKPTTDTLDDEFDSTTLDGKWTAVSGSSGTVDLLETGEVEKYDLTTRPGWLLMQAGSVADQKVELRQDLTLADGASVILAISLTVSSDDNTGIGANELWAGISINDNDAGWDAGEYNALFFDVEVNGWRLLHYDGTSAFGATGPSGTTASSPVTELIYLRFMRSGSVVYAFWSVDGSSWMAMGSETRSATATNIWIFTESVAAASEPVPIVAVDWIRQGTNNLDPWSHSGLVQLDTVPEWMTFLARRVPGETAHAYDDFFDDGDKSDWTEVQISGTLVATEKYGMMSLKSSGDSMADLNGVLKPLDSLTAPLTIETAVRYQGSVGTGAGEMAIGFTDGVIGTSGLAGCRGWAAVAQMGFIGGTLTDFDSTWVNYMTRGEAGQTGHQFMRCIWKSANTFRIMISPDGISWDDIAAIDLSRTLTPTYFGLFCSNYGQTDAAISSYEYFRVYDADLSA